MINTLHTGGIVAINTTTPSYLYGVSVQGLNTGFKPVMEMAGGQAQNSFVACMNSEPVISLTISDLARAFTLGIDNDGYLIDDTNTFDLFFTQLQRGGTRTAGSTHKKITVNGGLIVPKTLSVKSNGTATLTVEVHGSLTDSNFPVEWSSDVAIPGKAIIDQLFTLGQFVMNGAIVPITGLDLDFGITVIKEYADGEVFPSFIGISKIEPKITVSTNDTSTAQSLALTGTPQGGSSTFIVLQKLSPDGGRVAADVAEHIIITITADQGMIYAESVDTTNGETAETKVTIIPTIGYNVGGTPTVDFSINPAAAWD